MDSETFRIKLAIPDKVSLNRVDLKKTPLKKKFGVCLEVENLARCVTLRGNEMGVKRATEELQHLFSQYGAPFTRKGESRRIEPRPSRSPNRSLAVVSLDNTPWQFVTTSDGVNDVDVSKFPYELVRVTGGAIRATSARRQTCEVETAAVVDFDDAYLAHTACSLNNASDLLKLKAVFGRKLFCRRKVNPGALYSVGELADVISATSSSVWSNVCDADGPVLKALLSLLQTKVDNGDGTQVKLGLSVRLAKADGDRDVKLKFAREDDEWVYRSTVFPGDTRHTRDIVVADRLAFRARASAKSEAATDASALHGVTVRESDNGDVLTPSVTLAAGGRARVKWVSVKSAVTVHHEGLEFKIIRQSREGNLGWMLEAKLPEPVAGSTSVRALGDSFELLATKVQSILCEVKRSQA